MSAKLPDELDGMVDQDMETILVELFSDPPSSEQTTVYRKLHSKLITLVDACKSERDAKGIN